MIVTVTGGRAYTNATKVFETLNYLHEREVITLIVQGGATGADHLAVRWAREHGVPYCTFPANFDFHGAKGGPIRNRYMLKFLRPTLLVVFPGNEGTAGCREIASKMGVTILDIK